MDVLFKQIREVNPELIIVSPENRHRDAIPSPSHLYQYHEKGVANQTEAVMALVLAGGLVGRAFPPETCRVLVAADSQLDILDIQALIVPLPQVHLLAVVGSTNEARQVLRLPNQPVDLLVLDSTLPERPSDNRAPLANSQRLYEEVCTSSDIPVIGLAHNPERQITPRTGMATPLFTWPFSPREFSETVTAIAAARLSSPI
jgi:CheY-like chemotaxis protein